LVLTWIVVSSCGVGVAIRPPSRSECNDREEVILMTRNTRQTGARAASSAGRVLQSSSSTKAQRSAAASTLAQRGTPDQTGRAAASAASRTLRSSGSTAAQRSAAASALAQKPKRK